MTVKVYVCVYIYSHLYGYELTTGKVSCRFGSCLSYPVSRDPRHPASRFQGFLGRVVCDQGVRKVLRTSTTKLPSHVQH